jgi:mannose/cellobiose epimerase-like protein (N-acyl-D-glucosamine 2-epimerase family)
MPQSTSEVHAAALAACDELTVWLNEAAYPLWSANGWDHRYGGFQEALDLNGSPVEVPRRARVQPRQVYAFSQAPRMGWHGDPTGVITQGLEYFLTRYRRPDGLFRAAVRPDGTCLDNAPVLYDQAFALLGFAAADSPVEADRLRAAILRNFKRKEGGFVSEIQARLPLQSNPHMHLFEASLAWSELTGAAEWRAMADEIGGLAVARLIDPTSGVVRENYAEDWTPAPGLDGRRVEPGHQYEWAWLLLRWAGLGSPEVVRAARRLVDVSENSGVSRGVAVNALLDDFSIHDADARLWPQGERLKANALSARLFGEERYWHATLEAATLLLEFLDTPLRGLWYDKRLLSGEFVRETVPASSFYHIVDAISELAQLVRHPTAA